MTSTGEIAPGAEDVGQARIVTELSKPFELGALFQGADEGAFGDNPDDEMAMDDGDEGQVEVDMDEAVYVTTFLYECLRIH